MPYVILLVEVIKYYFMRKCDFNKYILYILLCILLILAFNAFWFLACAFGPDTRYHPRYVVPNKDGDEIQQYIKYRNLTNSSRHKFVVSQIDTLENSIVRYKNRILLSESDLKFDVNVFSDSVLMICNFSFGERFKSKHKLQLDSCYYITDYGVDYEGYKAITFAVEDALFGDSIIFKNDTKFYDIATMKHEVDAKTWYRQRNIWFAVLHKPHLTFVIPLLILIIIGLPIIYYKTKSNK